MAGILSSIYGSLYQVSPIWLTGGLVQSLGVSGNLTLGPVSLRAGLPLSLITEIATLDPISAIVNGLPSQAFANYRPLPGSTLVKYQVAEYPFYTQQIAANASIKQPNSVSMLMYCPATGKTNLSSKSVIMAALQLTIDNHVQQGGTFTVLTPASIYTNCLLLGITDVSTEQTNQAQWAYQFDFVQPLLTFNPAPNSVNKVLGSLLGGT